MRKFEFDSCEEALGDHSTQLRVMSVVNASRLSAGHVFQLKGTLRLRIVEEANLRKVKIKVMRSDIENLIVAGFHFYVCARLEYPVTSTMIWALKLVKNRRSTLSTDSWVWPWLSRHSM